jgi:N-acetylmuramoyl-L-alanine amidase
MEKTILNKNFILLFIILFFSNILFANNHFVKSQIRQGELKLEFSSDIKRVTYFSIPVRELGLTKHVYDIHGAVLLGTKGISHHSFRTIKSFRMGQNSPEKLRLVIVSKKKKLEEHVFKSNFLMIPLTSKRKATIVNTPRVSIEKTETKIPYIPKVHEEVKENNSSYKYIVVIDAGHGGKDNGASCCGNKREKKVVLSVAVKLKKRLEKKGYKVYMTRTDDSFIKLPRRTEFANKKKADIFVSIHANAAPNEKLKTVFKGIEIYYLSPAKTERAKKAAAKENAVMFQGKDFYTKNEYLSLISREKIIESHKLGLDVSHKMLSTVRRSFGSVANGGVKPANFWVLVGAQMPAVLVETGYITHPEEGKNLINSYYKSLLAKGIAEGISRYLRNKK